MSNKDPMKWLDIVVDVFILALVALMFVAAYDFIIVLKSFM